MSSGNWTTPPPSWPIVRIVDHVGFRPVPAADVFGAPGSVRELIGNIGVLATELLPLGSRIRIAAAVARGTGALKRT